MPRFRVLVEYEGTRYSGWQVQKNARTVQGEIQDALRSVLGSGGFDFMGSGRTDAGVHALAQVAHLEASTMLAPEILRMKLNDALPPDICVLAVDRAEPRFHARHHAVARSYLYQIARRRTAFGKRFVWWVKDPLDAARMASAARLFVGLKDFASFTDDDPEEKSTKVLVEQVTVAEAPGLILVRVEGSHFLWKMVRRIVGVLVEVGRGSMAEQEVTAFIRGTSEGAARFTAPPSGLFLEKVYYEGEPRNPALRPVLNLEPAPTGKGGKRRA
jgi:tRNA pseudouridine38-40 synthase